MGPNGSGKTSLLRAIEVICSHMIRPKPLPKAYYHDGDTEHPLRIEMDVEFNDDEIQHMSDFLVHACIFQMHKPDENMFEQRGASILSRILDNNSKRLAGMCSKMTVALLADDRSAPPEIFLQIGKGDRRIDIWRGTYVQVAGLTPTWSSRHAASLILDRAMTEVRGFKSYISGRSKKRPAGLREFGVDLFEMIKDSGSDRFKLGTIQSGTVRSRRGRKFRRTPDFLGGRVEGTITFNTIVAQLLSRSIVKMSEMQTRPEKTSLPNDMQETDVENVTGLDLVRTLSLMERSNEPATISRYKKVTSKMNEETGLDVRIDIDPVQDKKDPLAAPQATVRFLRDTLPIPAELVAGGDIELLIILTTLIGRSGTILLLDEPASSLHPNRQKAMRELMCEASGKENGKNQIVLVTHSPFLTDPYGREPLWRFARGKTGTKMVDAGEILSEHEKAVNIMQRVDVRSMMFQQGVIIVEGLSDKILIESTDELMAEGEEGDGPGIADSEWIVLDAGGKNSAFPLSRMAKGLGIQYIVVVDRDALMAREKKTRIGGKNVPVSSVIHHINRTHELSEEDQKIIMGAGRRASANGGKEYDSDDFDALYKIARSHNIHVLYSDIEGVIGVKKGGTRGSKIDKALKLIDQMRETGCVPKELADLVRLLGKAIRDTDSSGDNVALTPP